MRYGVSMLQVVRVHPDFDLRHVDRTVFVPRSFAPNKPTEPLEIVRGGFDPQTTEDALEGCSECEPPLLEERNGIDYYSWGEDNVIGAEKAFALPSFDRVGRGGRIAVLDAYVLRTIETAEMEFLIDTQKGRRDSLAEYDEFKLLAQAMDSMGAYSIYLTDDTETWQVDNAVEKILDSYTGSAAQEMRRNMSKGPLLRPYNALAAGVGQDEQGHFMAIALLYDDSDVAKEDIPILEARVQQGESIRFKGRFWREFFSNVELRSEGRLLLGKLRGNPPDRTPLIFEVIEKRDSLFFSE